MVTVEASTLKLVGVTVRGDGSLGNVQETVTDSEINITVIDNITIF